METRFEHKAIKKIISASLSSMGADIIGLSMEEDAKAIAIFVPPNYTGSKAIPFLIGGGISYHL
jgi:hypothetical protein